MLRNVHLNRWKAGTPQEAIDAIIENSRDFPERFPEIRSMLVGVDHGLDGVRGQPNYDMVITLDFDDDEGYCTFMQREGHRTFVEKYVLPYRKEFARIQFVWNP